MNELHRYLFLLLFGIVVCAVPQGVRAGESAPELVLESGVKWLASAQEEDGRWDSRKHGSVFNRDVESTALGLLSYLGYAMRTGKNAYSEKSQRAVQWLLKHQSADGALRNDGDKDVNGITHALALMALAEAAAAGDAHARRGGELAVKYAVGTHQCEREGKLWGFGIRARDPFPELIPTGLFAAALKSAHLAKLNPDPNSFEGMIQFIDGQDRRRRKVFLNLQGELASPAEGLAAVTARQFMGFTKESTEDHVSRLMNDAKEFGAVELYAAGLACYRQGGDLWTDWLDAAWTQLMKTQKIDGSWDPDGTLKDEGRVIQTALGVMPLCATLEKWTAAPRAPGPR